MTTGLTKLEKRRKRKLKLKRRLFGNKASLIALAGSAGFIVGAVNRGQSSSLSEPGLDPASNTTSSSFADNIGTALLWQKPNGSWSWEGSFTDHATNQMVGMVGGFDDAVTVGGDDYGSRDEAKSAMNFWVSNRRFELGPGRNVGGYERFALHDPKGTTDDRMLGVDSSFRDRADDARQQSSSFRSSFSESAVVVLYEVVSGPSIGQSGEITVLVRDNESPEDAFLRLLPSIMPDLGLNPDEDRVKFGVLLSQNALAAIGEAPRLINHVVRTGPGIPSFPPLRTLPDRDFSFNTEHNTHRFRFPDFDRLQNRDEYPADIVKDGNGWAWAIGREADGPGTTLRRGGFSNEQEALDDLRRHVQEFGSMLNVQPSGRLTILDIQDLESDPSDDDDFDIDIDGNIHSLSEAVLARSNFDAHRGLSVGTLGIGVTADGGWWWEANYNTIEGPRRGSGNGYSTRESAAAAGVRWLENRNLTTSYIKFVGATTEFVFNIFDIYNATKGGGLVTPQSALDFSEPSSSSPHGSSFRSPVDDIITAVDAGLMPEDEAARRIRIFLARQGATSSVQQQAVEATKSRSWRTLGVLLAAAGIVSGLALRKYGVGRAFRSAVPKRTQVRARSILGATREERRPGGVRGFFGRLLDKIPERQSDIERRAREARDLGRREGRAVRDQNPLPGRGRGNTASSVSRSKTAARGKSASTSASSQSPPSRPSAGRPRSLGGLGTAGTPSKSEQSRVQSNAAQAILRRVAPNEKDRSSRLMSEIRRSLKPFDEVVDDFMRRRGLTADSDREIIAGAIRTGTIGIGSFSNNRRFNFGEGLDSRHAEPGSGPQPLDLSQVSGTVTATLDISTGLWWDWAYELFNGDRRIDRQVGSSLSLDRVVADVQTTFLHGWGSLVPISVGPTFALYDVVFPDRGGQVKRFAEPGSDRSSFQTFHTVIVRKISDGVFGIFRGGRRIATADSESAALEHLRKAGVATSEEVVGSVFDPGEKALRVLLRGPDPLDFAEPGVSQPSSSSFAHIQRRVFSNILTASDIRSKVHARRARRRRGKKRFFVF